MRTASICPTCATYTNSICVIYDGPFLPTTNIEPGNSIQESLIKIEEAISGGPLPGLRKVEITSTGERSNWVFSLVSPVSIQFKNKLYTSNNININCIPGFNLNRFESTETTLSFDNLTGINTDGYFEEIYIASQNNLLEEVHFPELKVANCGIDIVSNSLSNVTFPKLEAVQYIYVRNQAVSSFPMLEFIQELHIQSGTNSSVTTIDFPSLKYAGWLNISGSYITNINFPILETIYGNNYVNSISGCTSLVDFSFPDSLKEISTTNFLNLNNNAFSQSTVDGILVKLASLDGTNGTKVFSNKTINLTGGTNSAPSATGLAAKSILQSRGCTVTTN